MYNFFTLKFAEVPKTDNMSLCDGTKGDRPLWARCHRERERQSLEALGKLAGRALEPGENAS